MPNKMHEQLVSRGVVASIVLWVMTGFWVVLTWINAFAGPHYAGACAVSAVVTAVIAGVVQIKLYVVRVCQLIRVVHGYAEDPNLPPVRRLERI